MGTPDAAGPGTTMVYRVHRGTHRMPLLVAFTLVALFIGIAESIATSAGAWLYPDQVVGWQPVSASTLVSWFLLMIVSVLLARPPAARTGRDCARRPPRADHRRLTAERPPSGFGGDAEAVEESAVRPGRSDPDARHRCRI
ncbi:hypothetical protein C5C18_10025 [Rathayibacter tritici]|uniref:DUF817 family protein n=1 Tax=Rathayibacter tritici TaxID=33888 RepID=UPI000CE82B81|nr:DUF817 family protein [Rathayibacter tritici]PPF30976.1 hypothetical protein C5C06_03295 [Rathayibacter tritici]PPF67459.1 hypothetical protein C5C21_06860 [Rathayibacter tritici]PPG06534.1 hypothetical protein C5C18_10025 [Rathayibacter tritici]PPI16775.1 hypothetical protein C5D07_05880 [Rathayibacter tritici]